MGKRTIKIISLLLVLGLSLTACSFPEELGLKWLDQKAANLFKQVNEQEKQSVIEFMESNKKGESTEEAEDISASNLSQKEKEQIDEWLEKKGFNRYGDDKSAVYTGGTPLFNEETGESMDRYDYILNKFPDILKRIEEE